MFSSSTPRTVLVGLVLAATLLPAPAHSHEGRDIAAFRWDGSTRDGVYKIHADGAVKEKLSDRTPYFQSADTKVAISPDGGRVAFADGGPWRSHIYVSDLATGETRRITSGRRMIIKPSWSPSGSRLVAKCGDQICTMRTSGRARLRSITSNRYPEDNPQWSPDGTRIVFQSRRGLISIRPNGRALRRLTRNRHDRTPRWSPDSGRILFTREAEHGAALVTVNRRGRNRVEVTNYEGWDREAEWSPDGSSIVFLRLDGADGTIEDDIYRCGFIYTVEPEGANPTRLSECFEDGTYAVHFPTWSPDGDKITYTTAWRPPGEETRMDVFVMKADGSGVRNVTNEPESGTRYFGLDW